MFCGSIFRNETLTRCTCENIESCVQFIFSKVKAHGGFQGEYRMEGNFDSGKIWRIHCINTLAEENLANCEILPVKISRKHIP